MNTYTKENLGWNDFLESHIKNNTSPFSIARVAIENRNNYLLYAPGEGEALAECTGKLLFQANQATELPKTGDWVWFQKFEENKGIIHAVFPRRKVLSRKVAGELTEEQIIATHVDKVLIVQGLDQNFNINRLLRSVVMVREAGITPIIILNKKDIGENMATKLEQVKKQLANVEVQAISALKNDGVDAVLNMLKSGETFVLMGSSGAGKSTLVNALMGKEIAATQQVRNQDSKGKHTTTRREMHLLPNGVILIDTPGMRELQLMSAKTSLDETFDDVGKLAEQCRFKDCTHTNEVGCAVLAALESDELSESSYQNYLKLKKEDAYMESRVSQKAYLEKKAKEKQLHKHIRSITKKRKFK